MTKKLSIIIPFFRESVQQLAIGLSSINNQIGVDFSELDVHLVSDGASHIDVTRFDIFGNLELIYHELPENVGLGMARQFGIDHSEGEYIMFMDGDDELHFAGALLEFFNVCKYQGEFQIISASVIEQYKNEVGEFRYFTHPALDWKFPVAKWFNRAYLDAIGLRFHPNLRTYEETYFVHLACLLATNIYYLESVVYSWLWNPNSIVRGSGRSFEYQTHIWAKARRYFLETLREKRPDLVADELEGYLIYTYFQTQRFAPADENAFWEENRKILAEFGDFWQGYSERLQDRCNAETLKEGGKWQGDSTAGFKDFVAKFSKLNQA